MTQPFVISMKATLDPSDLRSGAQASSAAIREIETAATNAERSVKASIFNATEGLGNRSSRQAAADIEAYARELDSLRARYNPLYAASKQYEAELDAINRAQSLGAINAQEQAAAISRLDAQYTTATQAANMSTVALRNNAGAMRVNSFHTANLAAQFNDIGVMMAAGQSPLQLALQQGTQISQVLGPMGAGGAVRALGAGFMAMINPISIATIAVIGLGAAGFQALMGMMNATEDASRSLEDHADWLDGILAGYEKIQEAVRDYVDEASRLPTSLAQLDITEQLNTDLAQLEAAQRRIADFAIRDDAFIPISSINDDLAVLRQIKSEFDSNAISAEDFATKLRLIEMNPNVDDEVREIAGTLYDTTQEAAELEIKVESAREALELLAAEARHLDGTSININILINGSFDALDAANDEWLQSTLDDRTEAYEDAVKGIERLTPDLRTAREQVEAELAAGMEAALSDEQLAVLQDRYDGAMSAIAEQEAQREAKASARGGKRQTAYERATESIRKNIDALNTERMALGLSEEAALRFTTAMELVRAAEEDGVVVTAALLEQINGLAGEFVTAEIEAGRFGDNVFDMADELESAFDGVGSGIVRAMREGGDVAGSVLDMLIDKAFQFAGAWADDVIGDGIGALVSMIFPGSGGSGASVVPNAKGNVYGGNSISAWRNQIVDQPTFFAFAKGGAIGVMGEAGEEAIMPLARNSSGQLGVHVANGNQANDNWRPQFNFEQNITPPSGYEMRSREEETPAGRRQEVWFEEAVAGAISRPGRAQRAVRNSGRLTKR